MHVCLSHVVTPTPHIALKAFWGAEESIVLESVEKWKRDTVKLTVQLNRMWQTQQSQMDRLVEARQAAQKIKQEQKQIKKYATSSISTASRMVLYEITVH